MPDKASARQPKRRRSSPEGAQAPSSDAKGEAPPQPPNIALATHWCEERYLFAFATQAEVLDYVRTHAIKEDRDRLPEIKAAWRKLQPRVAELEEREAGLPDTIQVRPLPKAYWPRAEAYAADPLIQKAFYAIPYGFTLVEVDKLIAPQRSVNFGYVNQLARTLPQAPTMDDLIEICISPTRALAPIQHLELHADTHVFTSPNSDLRCLGAFVKELTPDDLQYAEYGGLPAAAIITFVGYGASPVNVYQAGNRVVLHNGFHRVYALRSLGVREIPVLVQEVKNVQLEFPENVLGLPAEYLLETARPVLIKDFFEPDFAITLHVQQRLRLVSIAVSHRQHHVPA
jgi:hypothetical protein